MRVRERQALTQPQGAREGERDGGRAGRRERNRGAGANRTTASGSGEKNPERRVRETGGGVRGHFRTGRWGIETVILVAETVILVAETVILVAETIILVADVWSA